ncbi:histidine phosphatase family protein [Mucilaginibacter sp. AW1-3]
MKLHTIKFLLFTAVLISLVNMVSAQSNNLKLVFIRHGEKPLEGSNLTCQGLNRALKLPAVINEKFGVPAFLFVPGLGLGETTKHARMFQTIAPLAMQYNLPINSSHAEKDFDAIAADLKSRKGTVVITWEHKAIAGIVKALGVDEALTWPDDDYDSIWIVTFNNGKAQFTKDKENIKPATGCPI